MSQEIYPMESNKYFDYPGPGLKKVMTYNQVLVWVALFYFDEPFISLEVRDFINKNQDTKISSTKVSCALRVFRYMGYVDATFSTRGSVIQYTTSFKFRDFRRKQR